MEVTVTISPQAGTIDRVLASMAEVLRELAEDPLWAGKWIAPPQSRGVREINALGVTLSVLLITHTAHQRVAQREVLRRVLQCFQTEGIPIAFIPELRSMGGSGLAAGPHLDRHSDAGRGS